MKKLQSRKSLVLLAVIVVNIVNALGGILGNVVSDDIREILIWAGIFQYRFQITLGLLIIGLLAAAWVSKAEKDGSTDEIPAEAFPESELAPRRFLADLAGRYQKRNAHKLDGRYEISLVVSDDVEGTQSRQFDDEFGADAHSGEAARYIIERFERQGRLLIVGGPGSGKTVLLLALAQYLTEKAQKDFSQPLPVIFNLDSWSSEYAHFLDWVKAMLTKGYGLSPDFAGQLLADRRIVFLLDGLDELARDDEPNHAAQMRAECLAALDKFLYDGTMNAVICCRREQFVAMLRQTDAKPPVAAVVAVQDLTAGQIDRALIRASATPRDKFAAPHLLEALGQDRNGVYEQVLATPFYFTTALQVFDSTRPPTVEAPDKGTLEFNLIAAFIDKKIKVTPNLRRFSARQTLVWLTWLAGFLGHRKGVTFELSDLQPSALKRPRLYRLAFCLLFGVVGSITIDRFHSVSSSFFFLSIFTMIGPFIVMEDLVPWALAPLRLRRTWRNILLVGLVVGVLLVALQVALGNVATSVRTVIGNLTFGVITTTVIWVVILTVIRLIRGMLGPGLVSTIPTEDFAQWTLEPLCHWRTWRSVLRRGLVASVTVGIFGGVILCIGAGVAVVATNEEEYFKTLLVVMMILGLFGGALLGAAVGAVFGLFLGTIKACRRIARFAKIHSPYQRLRAGIVFSVFQSAVMGAGFICSVLTLALLFRGKVAFQNTAISRLFILLFIGFGFGFFGLFRTSLLKHSVLRACLTLQGAMPLRYAAFLSYATELRILEKDGGQWRFRHQILQDYFDHRPQDKGGGSANT